MAAAEKDTETVVLDEDILKEIVEREESPDRPRNEDSRLVRLEQGDGSPAADDDDGTGEDPADET